MIQKIKGRFGYIMAGILLIVLFASQCGKSEVNNEIQRLKNNIEALNDTITYKDNKLGGITAEKKAYAVTEKELRKQIYVKDERIAKLTEDFTALQSVTSQTQEVRIVKIPVPYHDTIPCVFERVNNVREKWYAFDVYSNQKGISIDSLKIPNEQFIVIGQKREGIFKPSTLKVEVTNTNPFIKTVNVQTQVIQVKQPFYNKGWFRAIEFTAGVILGSRL